ncbi:hypothetical protein [Halomonas piscis]|nr:hypothetical protein [Halomonas piscis]
MTGLLSKPWSERPAERRAMQMVKLVELTQQLLNEHESAWQWPLSDVRSTTERAIHVSMSASQRLQADRSISSKQ